MRALALGELQQIAVTHGIRYDTPPDVETDTERVVRTTLSREFAIARDAAFNTFADPQRHVGYFDIIKASTPLIPLEGPLNADEYIVLEHVQEENLPPRLMVVKYTLTPPSTIRKEAVTDPFSNTDIFSDKKRGLVVLKFDEVGRDRTQVTCDSTFSTNRGPVFVRGFIDHVWLNFYEKLMVETGELAAPQMLTGQ
jgi:hypothetical protein